MSLPVFSIQGVPVTTAHVGDTITFDVPGQSQIWLYQTKDGHVQWNAAYAVPSAYTLLPVDVGHYQTYAYQLQGGTYGALLGATSIDILPVGGVIDTITSSPLLLYGGLALVAYFLLRR